METKGLKVVGKGNFSTVYRLNEKQVLIKSICYVKECISMDWHISTGVFPVLQRIEQGKYICEYYQKVNSLKESLDAKHYTIYSELRKLRVNRGNMNNQNDLYFLWREEFKKIKNRKYREALIDMIDNITNYGSDIDFEISPRNVAVKNGKLILLDVFFIASQNYKIKASKRQHIYQ